jgi:hypothetical protein
MNLKTNTMFNIKTYEVCKATGFVSFEIEFAMWKRPKQQFKENYKCEGDAQRRIERLQIDYLLFTLENYVSTCRKLFEFGAGYNTASRKLALEKCGSGVHYLQDKQLSHIAALILKLQPFLIQILPPASSPDYEFLYSIQIRLTSFSSKVPILKITEPCQA